MSYSSSHSISSVDDNILSSLWLDQSVFGDITFADDPDVLSPLEPGTVATKSPALSSTSLPGSSTRGTGGHSPMLCTDAADLSSSTSSSSATSAFSLDDLYDLSIQVISSNLALQSTGLPWSAFQGPQGCQPTGPTYPSDSHSPSDLAPPLTEVPILPQAEGDLFATDNSDLYYRETSPVGDSVRVRAQSAPTRRRTVAIGTQTGSPTQRKLRANRRRRLNPSDEVRVSHLR